VQKVYVASSLTLSVILCGVGVAMLVSTVARGGGPFALGTVLGASLTVLGVARLWLARRAGPRGET